jgi:hypothetical protein
MSRITCFVPKLHRNNAVGGLFAAFVLAGCLGGGDSGPTAELGTVAPPSPTVVYPTPSVIPAAPVAIVGFTGTLGLLPTHVNTNTTGIANGDAVQIAGAGVAVYNGIFNVANVTPTGFDIALAYAGASAGVITQIIAGGVVSPGATANCPTTGNTGIITASAVASRYSGVAPLAVFFDATGTTATTAPTRPFHDLEYRWSFSDGGSGNWGPAGSRPGAGNSRNSATGPMAVHVFETAGTYSVSVQITDGTNTVTNDCIQIAVLDPDVVFAGNQTVCLSRTADLANCPAGALAVPNVANDFALALTTYIAAGKRVLLRRGQTWAAPTEANISSAGPGILGAFGPGADPKPIVQATGNNTILSLSKASTPTFSDWRIMDLEFDGLSGASTNGVNANGSASQILLLRLVAHHIHVGILFSSGILDVYNTPTFKAPMWDQVTVIDSDLNTIIGGAAGYGAFMSGRRFAFLGNSIDDTMAGEHGLRTPYVQKGIISNSSFSRAAPGKHVLTVRAPTFLGTATIPAGTYTEQIIVADNKFIGGSPDVAWTVTTGVFDATKDARVRNSIYERNWFTAGVDTQKSLRIEAYETTVRNNIFDTSGAGVVSRNGVTVAFNNTSGTMPPTDQTRIFNNTFYSGDTNSNFRAVWLEAPVTNVTVKNNLAYAPNDSVHAMIFSDAGAAAPTASNNSLNNDVQLTNPGFANATPTVPVDFKLTGGSYYVGTPVPVFSDFFGLSRPQTAPVDIGAAEF